MRAVHIEVVHSLDTDSLLALRRFIARRGQVQEIRSDNGTNFTSGERELLESWNHEKIHETLLQKNVKWIFNSPYGSHFGGIWERCLRSARRILSALLREQTADDEGLTTLMCEVESILNSRPITTVVDDPRDLEPLTPNHLLLLKAEPPLPPGLFGKKIHSPGAGGSKCNIWPMVFGEGGHGNTFRCFKADKSGYDLVETWKPEMSS